MWGVKDILPVSWEGGGRNRLIQYFSSKSSNLLDFGVQFQSDYTILQKSASKLGNTKTVTISFNGILMHYHLMPGLNRFITFAFISFFVVRKLFCPFRLIAVNKKNIAGQVLTYNSKNFH